MSYNPKTAVFTLRQIVSGEKPILYVTHDEDGAWQFLDGEDVAVEDAMVVAFKEIIKIDASITALLDLKEGFQAIRDTSNCDWQIQPSIM